MVIPSGLPGRVVVGRNGEPARDERSVGIVVLRVGREGGRHGRDGL